MSSNNLGLPSQFDTFVTKILLAHTFPPQVEIMCQSLPWMSREKKPRIPSLLNVIRRIQCWTVGEERILLIPKKKKCW